MIKKIVKVPVLNDEYNIDVYFGYEPKEMEKRLIKEVKDKHTNKRDLADALRYIDNDIVEAQYLSRVWGCALFLHKFDSKIWLSPDLPKHDIAGTLAHEAVHCVHRIFGNIGQNIDPFNDEVFAHSVGAVVRIVAEELANKPKRKK